MYLNPRYFGSAGEVSAEGGDVVCARNCSFQDGTVHRRFQPALSSGSPCSEQSCYVYLTTET